MQISTEMLIGPSLLAYAEKLRRGYASAEKATTDYLARIAERDKKIGAYRTVMAQPALDAAGNVDSLLRAGTDLGPLMGVPVAVKEIFAVDGLPVGANTTLDLDFLSLAEGPFIAKLRRAGCVILGSTKTTEFAAATINVDRDMPWNPADDATKRVCGGSSHGSAAAMSAGMCAFSIGSDTGGSVRLPAALCGVFGYKSSVGIWPTGGVFPLSPSMDSIGVLTRCADDASLIFATLEAQPAPQPPDPRQLRLGRPLQYFFDDCDPAVLAAAEKAIARLRAAGVTVVDVDMPDIAAALPVFTQLLFGEFVACIGRERLEAAAATIDQVPWGRIKGAMDITPAMLADLQWQQKEAVATGLLPDGIDALLSPTAPFQACPLLEVDSLETATAWNIRAGRYTRPGNFYGLCGTTIPIEDKGDLPIGLQLMGRRGADAALLAISRTVEAIVGHSAR